jgi:hypothetical protein
MWSKGRVNFHQRQHKKRALVEEPSPNHSEHYPTGKTIQTLHVHHTMACMCNGRGPCYGDQCSYDVRGNPREVTLTISREELRQKEKNEAEKALYELYGKKQQLLEGTIEALKTENAVLKNENEVMHCYVGHLRKNSPRLTELVELEAKNAELEAKSADLEAKNAELEAKIARLSNMLDGVRAIVVQNV